MTIIRERIGQAAAKLEHIEVALFSTFTFSADFFEQNALPALFGCQGDERGPVRDARVHKSLSSTRVAVLYDASLLRPSKRRFRYSALPVYQGPNRLFHPKNLILFGKDRQGESWIYVAAMSANLSISGWGRNCEGISDTWIHAKSEQPAKELLQYLQWLQNGRNNPSDVLTSAIQAWDSLRAQRSLTDPEGGPSTEKRDVRLYFSPLHQSLWSFVKQEYGTLRSATVGSPFWGDSSQAAVQLKGVELRLIAARTAPNFKTVNLGQKTLAQLDATHAAPAVVRAWHGANGRFHHIKFYQVQTSHGQFTGLGSCNFTDRGQFWSSDHGNVESMIFDRLAMEIPATVEIPPDTLPLESESEDDAPSALAAYVFLQYDWRDGTFRWQADGSASAFPITLKLPDEGQAVVLTDVAREGRRQGKLRARTFTFVCQNDGPHEGLVEEVNVVDSTLVYGRPLPAQDILLSWRNRSSAEPAPLEEDDQLEDEEGVDPFGGHQIPPSPRADTAFDWFLFYRCVQDMRGRLKQASADTTKLTELALTRSDSVIALCESVSDPAVPPVRQWLVVKDCLALLKPYSMDIPNLGRKLNNLKLWEKELRNLVGVDLAHTLPTRRAQANAAEVLMWYDHKLSKATSK